MNRGKDPSGFRAGGYTIVETLIFLAVSSAMFFAAMALISGQTNKAQFVTVVRDFESKLTAIANDVSTGYYQNNADFSCTDGNTGPNVDFSSGEDQGTNDACIFVGTVVKFGEGTDREKFAQFAMAGLRTLGGTNVTSLNDAMPTVITNITHTRSISTNSVGYGATIQCLGVGNKCVSPSDTAPAAIGFFTKFVGTSPGGGNGIQTDLFPYPAVVSLKDPVASAITKINLPTDYVTGLNPTGGITICLKSGGTSQYALVHIGGAGNSLTISSEIKGISGGNLCT